MVDLRLYRAALLPFLLVVVVAAFSLGPRPRPLSTTLAPDAFDGPTASGAITSLGIQFPDRRPGSPGDAGLADFMQQAFGRSAGFDVTTHDFTADTVDGRRTLRDVIATRQGTSNRSIVIVAHRDAARAGSLAELSGTAALLELVHVFAGRITNRTLTLVSTSGGSGGDAGAAQLARLLPRPVDAVLVLGDLGGTRSRRPYVVPWSDGTSGSAPIRLRRTVEAALQGELSRSPGGVAITDQLSRLAFPLTTGEQGPLLAAGLPAVLIQGSGELGPHSGDLLSPTRMQALGRGVLRAVNALDEGADLSTAPTHDLLLGSLVLGAWTVRLLVGALLLPVLLAGVDIYARLRRRREAVMPWLGWLLSSAMPFALAGLFAAALGRTGLLPSAPAGPVTSAQLPIDGNARTAMISVLLVFALGWLGRRALLRAGAAAQRAPGTAGAGPAGAVVLSMSMLALLVWLRNPFAAALLVLPLHLWLLAMLFEPAPPRRIAIGLVVFALVPLLVVVGLDSARLELGPLSFCWTALLLVAGGHVGLLAVLAWSIAAGALVAALTICAQRPRERPEQPAVTVRGPMSYAGPGSLGGTDSALRR
ncbi:MAG: hypothetical protein ACR2ND_13390 [Solirubrobacteraceae bacterium]